MTDDLKSAIQALTFGLGIGLLCKAFSYSRLYSICIDEYSITDVRAVIFGTMILATTMFIAAKFREFLSSTKIDILINDQLKCHPERNLNWGWFRFLKGTILAFAKGPLYSWLIILSASLFVFADFLYFLFFNFLTLLFAFAIYSSILFPNIHFKRISRKINSEISQELQSIQGREHWSSHVLTWLGVFNPNAKNFLGFAGYSLIIGIFLFPGIKQDFGGGAPKQVFISKSDSLGTIERQAELLYLSPDHFAIVTDSSKRVELIQSSQISKLTFKFGSSGEMDTRMLKSFINTVIAFRI